ncbi:MAG TPA: hypothetical protein PK206_04935 [Chitinophagales bacterium]|nr:hypothetical protein [Chitinophagales bacterium]
MSLLFFLSGIALPEDDMPAYYWMTGGMCIVSFIYYYIVLIAEQKKEQKMLGGHLFAIVIKFMLSALVAILYILIFPVKQYDFVYFFVAYVIFSVFSYLFSYHFNKTV